MLKCILFLISEQYYKVVSEHMEEISEKIMPHQVEVSLQKVSATGEDILAGNDFAKYGKNFELVEEILIITDDAKTTETLLREKYYVAVLYHEQNKDQSFPPVRYAIEDLFQLDYKSYEEVYQRLAGLPWEILQTKRLLVRESTVDDVDEFYRIYKDPSITLYMENLYEDRDTEAAYMKAYIDQIYGFYGYGLWTVILKETGQIIGRAGLSIREGYDFPELGFLIDTAFQKQGYGFEVCNAILKYAREELAFEKVQALADERNVISINLLQKLGFIYDRDVTVENRRYRLYLTIESVYDSLTMYHLTAKGGNEEK